MALKPRVNSKIEFFNRCVKIGKSSEMGMVNAMSCIRSVGEMKQNRRTANKPGKTYIGEPGRFGLSPVISKRSGKTLYLVVTGAMK